eukprot:gene5810-8889_t
MPAFEAEWFEGAANADTDAARDEYFARVTEVFGDELFELQQQNWDERRVQLLVDGLEMGRRTWGDPLQLPPPVVPRCVAKG